MNDTHTPSFQFLKDIAADLARGTVTFPTFSQATEPLLAARLVAMANSAALNPGGRPIGDVKSAILRVGVASVRSVAVALALEQLKEGSQSATARPFAEATWRHSVQVAAIAFVIAKRLARINPDEALFAGLVHDIGHFYLLAQVSRYPDLEHNPEELAQVLASWHPSIGQAVLHDFNVSEALVEAVGEHENGHYHVPPRTLADVVTIANIASSKTNPVVSLRVDPATVITQREVVDALNDARQEIVALASALRG
jgi:HD-like signal output (HDOD) protein